MRFLGHGKIIITIYLLIAAAFLCIPCSRALDMEVITERVLPPQDVSDWVYLEDDLGNRHVLTIGSALVHYFQAGSDWKWEVVAEDPEREICGLINNGRILVLCSSWVSGDSGSFLATMENGVWSIETVPFPDDISSTTMVASGSTIWCFAKDFSTQSVVGLRRDASQWSDLFEVDQDGDCGDFLQAAVTGAAVHLVYKAAYPYFDLRHAIIDSGEIRVSTIRDQGDQGDDLSLCADALGTLHLSAFDGWDFNHIYGSYTDLEGWTFETLDPEWGHGQQNAICADTAGQPCIASVDPDSGFLHLYRRGKEGWSRDTISDISGLFQTPDICCNGMDEITVASMHRFSYTDGEMMIFDESETWEPETAFDLMVSASNISVFYDHGMQPVMVIDDFPNTLVMRRTGNGWERDSYCRDGLSYQNEIRNSTRTRMDASGTLHMATLTNHENSYHYTLEYWVINGSVQTIEKVTTLSDSTSITALFMDQQKPYILTTGYHTPLIQWSRSSDGVWDSTEIWPAGYYMFRSEQAMDGSRYLLIQGEFSEESSWLGCMDGDGWHFEEMDILPNSYLSYLSLALTSTGRPFIFYEYEDKQLYIEATARGWNKVSIPKIGEYYFVRSSTVDRGNHPVQLEVCSEVSGESSILYYYDGIQWETCQMPISDRYHGTSARLHPIWQDNCNRMPATLFLKEQGLLFREYVRPLPELAVQTNQWRYSGGDDFRANITIINGQDALKADLAVILEIPVGDTSLLFAAPDWNPLGEAPPVMSLDLIPEEIYQHSLISFVWPENAGNGGAALWVAMFRKDTWDLAGTIANTQFSY